MFSNRGRDYLIVPKLPLSIPSPLHYTIDYSNCENQQMAKSTQPDGLVAIAVKTNLELLGTFDYAQPQPPT